MATKIRLQRHGRKKKPYYFIVVVDSRAPRDGRFIERLGSYNPNTDPATIEVDTDRALHWVETGAIPTDTVRAMLSYKGVLYRKHLQQGVRKGALTQEQADSKFAEWLQRKAGKIEQKINKLQTATQKQEEERVQHEQDVNRKRAEAIRAKRQAELEATTASEGSAEESTENE